MLGEALTLRSAQPAGIEQEIWGALIACNLVRLEMIRAAGMAPGKLPAHLNRLRRLLQFAIVEKRRGRQSPRQVKTLPKRYTVRYLKKGIN